MGYRSEWKLVVKGDKAKLDALLVWIKAQAKPDGNDWYTDLPGLMTEGTIEGTPALVFGDTYSKCYEDWDAMVAAVIDHARELGLLAAVGRLGEDATDAEFTNDDGLYVEYERCLCDPLDKPAV